MAEGANYGTADVSSYKQQQPNLLQTAAGAMQLAQGAQALQASQFDLHNKQLGAMRDNLSTLLSLDDGQLNRQTVAGAVGQMVQQGILSPKIAAVELANMPNDAAGIRQKLKGHLLNNLQAQQRLDFMLGTFSQRNLGDRDVTVIENRNKGTVTPAGGSMSDMTRGVSPEYANEPVAGPLGPNNEPQMTTRGALSGAVGGQLSSRPTVPDNRLMGGAAVPMPTPRPNSLGVAPPAAQPSTVPGATPQAASPYGQLSYNGRTIPTITMGPAPGDIENQRELAGGSAKQLIEDRATASQITQRNYPLEQAISSVERLGKTGVGPGTETLNLVKSFLQSAGIPGLDADKISDWNVAAKNLNDYVTRRAGALGGAGVEGLKATFKSNPNMNQDAQTILKMAKSAIALDRMQAAAVAAFDRDVAAGKTKETKYQQWLTQWNAQNDPRGFAADLMGPEEFAKLRQEMKKKDSVAYQRFANSVASAHQFNLMRSGGGQ